ncbi:unnamed protein product [Darwinula stevensoni]|uniref:Mitochondrial thiamine pyrophosphate carrier n=1 Tax=Darwinula stevensoni TaxID=69355 RepID=A0A7R8X357_9CRUS|nr:unnamed protein product [Darwinula stevensoni]CAG0884625.1 unnamed protein product [Darwinula stevensoni]
MVGYDPKEKTKALSKAQYGLAGATTGCVTRALLQPLDVLKIRFQVLIFLEARSLLQLEPVRSGMVAGKYVGMFHAMRVIVQEEGLIALWKGHASGQVLSGIFGIMHVSTNAEFWLQLLSYEILTKEAWTRYPRETNRVAINLACGGSAGIIATVASFPFDVVRTRFVSQGEPKVSLIYTGMIPAFSGLLREGGVMAMYKGLRPTLLMIAPYSALQFAFYQLLVDLWRHLQRQPDHGSLDMVGSLVCGSLSGVSARTFTHPLDVMKKRLQVQGFEEARRPFGKVGFFHTCTDLINCLYYPRHPHFLKSRNFAGVTKN